VVVSGDGFGIASLAEEGTLRTNPPVLYSGDLTAADLAGLAADGPSFVVTDSNRRVAYSFDAPRDNHSYTLPAGATLGDRAIGYGLFGDRAGTQTVAVYQGVRSITATGYGSGAGGPARAGRAGHQLAPFSAAGEGKVWLLWPGRLDLE